MSGEEIGGAVYGLDLDSGTFTAGSKAAEQSFARVRAAGDAVARSQGTVQSTIGSVGRTAVAVALGMGGLNIAVTGVNAALKGTIAAAAEDAASQARLQAAVRATGEEYSKYAAVLDDVIKKGQERGFSDDETRSALSILIAQTNSVTEATKRYAIAQDLARGANIDVVAASRLLGKITEDNVTALQRYGISVKSGATETEALAEVQRKFSGQAQAFAESTAGQFARTEDAISEAGESLGRILLPATVKISEHVAEGAQNLEVFLTKLEGVGHVGASVFPSLVLGATTLTAALAAMQGIQFARGVAGELKSVLAQRSQIAAENAALGGGGAVDLSTTSTTLGALGSKLATPKNAAIGFTVALVALDVAARHFTGSGLLDFLTGTAKAHEAAARAAAAQAEVEDALARFAREGVGPDAAKNLIGADEIEKANKALHDYESQLRQASQLNNAAIKFAPGTNIPLPQQAPVAQVPSFPDFTDNINKILALKPTYEQLVSIIRQAPELASGLNAELTKQAQIAGPLAVAIVKYSQAINDAKAAQADFKNSLSDLGDIGGDPFDVQIEALKAEKLELEALKNTMGDAFGAANQAHLDAIVRQIDQLQSRQEAARQAVSLFGAEVRQQYGSLAPAAIKTVTALLADPRLTDEQRIQIKVLLPDLFKIQSAFAAFIKALQAGATVDVALRIGATTAAPSTAPRRPFDNPFPGESQISVQGRQPVSDAAQKIIDDLNGKLDDLNKNAIAPLGAIADKTGKEISQTDKDLQALAEAFEAFHAATGGTLEDFRVLLQVAQDNIDLNKRQEDAAIALRVAAAEAADGNYQLRLSMVEIAEAAVAAGNTIPQQVVKIFGSIKDNAQSVLDGILSKPTREGTELQLRIDLLQRQAHILQRGGADASRVDNAGKKGQPQPTSADRQLATIESNIKALELEKSIREDDIRIMRDQAILADQQLDTDRTVINAYIFLIAIIRNVSEALNGLVGPLGGFGTAATGGFHRGLTIVGEQGRELVDFGDAGANVIPADLTASLLSGAKTLPQLNAGLDLGALDFRVPQPPPAAPQQTGVTIENGAIQINLTMQGDISDAAADRLMDKLEQRTERAISTAMRRGSMPSLGGGSGR